MRLAIIGAKGQLGSELAFQGRRHFDVIPFTHDDVSVEDPHSLKRVARSKPSVIVNTAAFHKVEACEKSPVRAFAVNALGPYHLSSLAREQNSLLVHMSTDFVFSGTLDSWSEEDLPCPINVYGASKAAGETAVRWISPKHLIIRVACLFGGPDETRDLNFVDLVLDKARKGEALHVSHERRTSPSYIPHIARKILDLVHCHFAQGVTGIFHVTGKGDCTWRELAEEILQATKSSTPLLPVEETGLRPRTPILRHKRLQDLGSDDLPHWKDGLREYLAVRALLQMR